MTKQESIKFDYREAIRTGTPIHSWLEDIRSCPEDYDYTAEEAAFMAGYFAKQDQIVLEIKKVIPKDATLYFNDSGNLIIEMMDYPPSFTESNPISIIQDIAKGADNSITMYSLNAKIQDNQISYYIAIKF